MRLLGYASLFVLAGTVSAFAQDIPSGQKVFNLCRACHQIGPTAKNLVGPKMNGLEDRKTGSIEGFSYSAANKDSGFVWNEETFLEYIKDPKKKMPGTKMVFAGVKDEKKAKDLWAFLKQYDADGKIKE